MKFTGLGGCEEIGASAYLLELDGISMLLDAGVRPQCMGWASLPSTLALAGKTIDAALISHCHVDHLGSLPVLMRFCPGAKIFMHESSADLASLLFNDYIRVMEKQRREHDIPEYPFYTFDEASLLRIAFRALPSMQPYSLYGHGSHGWSTIQVSFYPAGHVLGASGVLIEGNEASVFYTGDVCGHPQHVIDKASLPDRSVDVLIMECTHGLKEAGWRTNRREEERAFAQAITEIVEQEGIVLIPVFALGRMQEMLSLLSSLRQRGEIPHVPIHTNGIGEKITVLYDLNTLKFPFVNPDIRLGEIMWHQYASKIPTENRLPKPPAILLVSGGMLQESTFSFEVARRILPEQEHGILFVGYCTPDSPAWIVKNSKRGDQVCLSLLSPPVPAECKIESFNFTAHSYPDELVSLVRQLNPHTILLVHGEPESRQVFSNLLRGRFPDKTIVLPENGVEWSANK